jgi:hypothetical protein
MFGRSPQVEKPGIEAPPKRPWSLRKKLLIFGGLALIVVIALGVGLGVGLTRPHDGDDDGGDGGDGGDNGDIPENGPDRDEIWQPAANTTWQIILKFPMVTPEDGSITPDVEVYDLDMVDNDIETFNVLRDAGKKVICYFSAGSWEDWRDDKDDFAEADLGKPLDGWPDERWVNVKSEGVRNVMRARIKLAWRKGCDAIDPDNVDGYQNDNGLGLTSDDAIDYMRFLADEAGKYKMGVGLKNAGDIIPDVLDFINFSVNEQCIEYSECDTFAPFIQADKPVFNIEYPESAPEVETQTVREICGTSGNATDTEGFSKVIKNMVLDGWVEYCDGDTYTTEVEGS